MARTPIHPPKILSDELEEIGLAAKMLASVSEVPPNRRYQIFGGEADHYGGYGPAPRSVFRHVA